ncbi:MAG: hypothetical protein ACYSWU_11940 [Planctomycetota bacterium]|jgi:hypothetical protein
MAATRNICRFSSALILLTAFALPAAAGDVPPTAGDLEPALRTIRAVGPKGTGNRQAARAWDQLVQADAGRLPAILAGLDDAGPLAANWIRTAVDAVAERQLQQGGRLPADELERFVLDRRHAPRARRLAYEWLVRVDPSAPGRLLGGMLDDPSLELRCDAVARRIEEATALEKQQRDHAVAVYQRALSAARDLDQIKLLAGRLRKLGLSVDLPRHFGFLLRWKVIGPLDNTDEKGFAAVYPPERKIDLKARCQGKHGEVRWIDHVTRHEYGRVDLNKVLAEEKSVIAYAMTELISKERQEVELRAGSHNALKIWLNGRLVYRRNVYHMGSQMDQHVSRVVLEPGRNVILVKVCQNAIMEDWARYWGFQLRVCDANGTAVLSADRDK